MAKPSKPQKDTIERVMHEWKHGELETPAGDTVTDRKQAVAIALSESGSSNRQSPADNRRRLKRSKDKEATGESGQAIAEGNPTKADLYERAKAKDVPGRSRMSKAELAKAVKV